MGMEVTTSIVLAGAVRDLTAANIVEGASGDATARASPAKTYIAAALSGSVYAAETSMGEAAAKKLCDMMGTYEAEDEAIHIPCRLGGPIAVIPAEEGSGHEPVR